MADVRKVVTELPVLDSSEFPVLPTLPAGKVLKVLDSPLRKAEKEDVLAILTTAACREGKWHPVDADVFVDIMTHVTPIFSRQEVINCTWSLVGEGLVEIVKYSERDYVVPSLKLANMLSQSQLRYM